MNDRHPAGDSFPADPGAEYSYAAYGSAHYEEAAYGSYGTTDHATAGDGWSTGAYDAATAVHQGVYGTGGFDATGFDTTGFDTTGYETTGFDTTGHDATGYGTGTYDAGAYDAGTYGTAAYGTDGYETAGWDGAAADQSTGFIPHQPGPHHMEQDWPTHGDGTAQWDMAAFEGTGWDGNGYGQEYAGGYGADGYADGRGDYGTDGVAYGTGVFAAAAPDESGWANGYDTSVPTDHDPSFDGHLEAAYESYGTYGAYESPETDAHYGADTEATDPYSADVYAPDPYAPDPYAADPYAAEQQATDSADGHGPGTHDHPDQDRPAYEEPVRVVGSEAEPEPKAAAPGPQGRGRRRSPKPRRSALLTVAAPSAAVLGVAGIAAASVLPSGDEESAQAAPETDEVKVSPANSKLDTQLAGLREAGDDFADRASRTQERIDLKKRQEAERRRKAAEAARREALRPKFALPVQGAGISAYFGQAGINWMSVHTGLDFPVSYGTPVKAATDGTVRTQWNPAYGNMIVLTSPDGTETWYCHLSSTRIRSGSVKAGTVIGYSGNSGNSTGPHLHFEVRPGGGSAIDPLTWFRSHGLEPT